MRQTDSQTFRKLISIGEAANLETVSRIATMPTIVAEESVLPVVRGVAVRLRQAKVAYRTAATISRAFSSGRKRIDPVRQVAGEICRQLHQTGYEPMLDGFKRFLRFLVPGHDVSPIVIEQKRPRRDVVKTSFVDRGQSSAILDGDHHPDVKDRACFVRHSKR